MTTIILFWILILTVFMAMSTSSLFSLWICMEINMMMFMPMMNSKNILSSNSMILYFIIQSLASSIFILSFLINFLMMVNYITMMLITSAILIKLGAAPFHIWFPQVSEGLKFMPFSFLILNQKLIPLYILSFLNNSVMVMSIIFSSLIGSFGGWNQNSIRKIIAFSTIAHLSWMISIILCYNNWWTMYFFMYSFIIITLIFFLFKTEMSYINQTNFFLDFSKKISLITILMSLGGMPPFLGFLMKWMSIKIISMSNPIFLFFLIPSSLLNLFFYSRIMYPYFFKKMEINKMAQKMKKSGTMTAMNFLLMFLMIPMI
uniref:NADH-ubiquinone oxidoreductase chain 2 n=1 Tax=Navis striatus TaxID=1580118 RepID=A0A1P8AGC9_9ACAR|nr:NADH dehydrogenase subunit 2 [Navis striatus]AIZ58458.1 NADH dehydrogenase subunit 2 [Navis striatus]AIZ58471.1 NADH dehydrogenase subunit 2 [Navis striatus]AMX74125.1 NADH dehydrogenase subunit 2 [Navis striatus]QLD97024.1 NADH dehydrogenase subunit 2 [Navis striatus]QLD97037.1 NADH dehydrogenase subunit 2 [Navis striatus]